MWEGNFPREGKLFFDKTAAKVNDLKMEAILKRECAMRSGDRRQKFMWPMSSAQRQA